MKRENGRLNLGDLASKMSRLKVVGENLTEQERASFIQDLYQNQDDEVDYEFFLKVCLCLSSLSLSSAFLCLALRDTE